MLKFWVSALVVLVLFAGGAQGQGGVMVLGRVAAPRARRVRTQKAMEGDEAWSDPGCRPDRIADQVGAAFRDAA